jgi:hypothetical protein
MRGNQARRAAQSRRSATAKLDHRSSTLTGDQRHDVALALDRPQLEREPVRLALLSSALRARRACWFYSRDLRVVGHRGWTPALDRLWALASSCEAIRWRSSFSVFQTRTQPFLSAPAQKPMPPLNLIIMSTTRNLRFLSIVLLSPSLGACDERRQNTSAVDPDIASAPITETAAAAGPL